MAAVAAEVVPLEVAAEEEALVGEAVGAAQATVRREPDIVEVSGEEVAVADSLRTESETKASLLHVRNGLAP